jgi:hypothetical protein
MARTTTSSKSCSSSSCAQILTLPYNPNNVSEDAAPVTVDLEIQVC